MVIRKVNNESLIYGEEKNSSLMNNIDFHNNHIKTLKLLVSKILNNESRYCPTACFVHCDCTC